MRKTTVTLYISAGLKRALADKAKAADKGLSPYIVDLLTAEVGEVWMPAPPPDLNRNYIAQLLHTAVRHRGIEATRAVLQAAHLGDRLSDIAEADYPRAFEILSGLLDQD